MSDYLTAEQGCVTHHDACACRQAEADRVMRLLADALRNLHAAVVGECPSLIDESRGGSAYLDLDTQDALAEYDRLTGDAS